MSVLVGKKAPDFSASAVVDGQFVENFTLSQFIGKKYVVLFFWPLDFTFVCPTEVIAFGDAAAKFAEKNVQLIGVSVDSKFTHYAWINTPRNQGGIAGVNIPLVSDLSKTISSDYDVLAGEYKVDYDDDGHESLTFEGKPISYRGLFLIDKQGVVRHQLVNDLPLGRSVDEALRIVAALQHYEQYGEVCPANWEEGAEAIKETMESVAQYLGKK